MKIPFQSIPKGRMQSPVRCVLCNCTGYISCPMCEGRKVVNGNTCPECGGSGRYTCPICRGEGYIHDG